MQKQTSDLFSCSLKDIRRTDFGELPVNVASGREFGVRVPEMHSRGRRTLTFGFCIDIVIYLYVSIFSHKYICV